LSIVSTRSLLVVAVNVSADINNGYSLARSGLCRVVAYRAFFVKRKTKMNMDNIVGKCRKCGKEVIKTTNNYNGILNDLYDVVTWHCLNPYCPHHEEFKSPFTPSWVVESES
jgi:hypothetical protein